MSNSLRIAIADDEPAILRYHARFIPRLGHEIVVASEDGEKLLEGVRQCRPDLVITDLCMPRPGGLDAVSQLEIPFIIVSANSALKWPNAALKDRCLGYLVKPINQTDLRHAIAVALDRLDRRDPINSRALRSSIASAASGDRDGSHDDN